MTFKSVLLLALSSLKRHGDLQVLYIFFFFFCIGSSLNEQGLNCSGDVNGLTHFRGGQNYNLKSRVIVSSYLQVKIHVALYLL